MPHYAELAGSAAKAGITGFLAINDAAAIHARRLENQDSISLTGQQTGDASVSGPQEATHPESKLAGNHAALIVIDNLFAALVDSHADESARQYTYPAGMRVIGYGLLPISDQSLYPAFLSVLCASSEAGGEWGGVL